MNGRLRLIIPLAAVASCARVVPPSPAVTSVTVPVASAAPVAGNEAARQLVVVTTPDWNAISGVMRRYTRESATSAWRSDGGAVPVVVGRTGLAWGDDAFDASQGSPRKHEGDGRAPAGMFPLDTAFGFAADGDASWVRLPYVALRDDSECVDDSASAHYNTVVDRSAVPRVDWTSAERMRQIDQYRLGVIVGYNAQPPRRGRGSCIFLHIWADEKTPTSGCTAFPAADVESLVRWLDPRRRPMLVQLPEAEYARLRERWELP
jgi:D-alanyl-D-alanine dipeptidase